jgi:TPR repeat protein
LTPQAKVSSSPAARTFLVLRDVGIAGSADVRKALELYKRQQYTEALSYFQRAAAAGNTLAMTEVGFMNEKGQGGLPRDDFKAAIWYRKAADADFPQAMVNLAVLYLDGQGGLPKDYAKAVGLCRKAADAGNPNGMLLLASMYEDGIGLPKDSAAARSWYQKSADLGNTYAQERLKQSHKGSKAQQ